MPLWHIWELPALSPNKVQIKEREHLDLLSFFFTSELSGWLYQVRRWPQSEAAEQLHQILDFFWWLEISTIAPP